MLLQELLAVPIPPDKLQTVLVIEKKLNKPTQNISSYIEGISKGARNTLSQHVVGGLKACLALGRGAVWC